MMDCDVWFEDVKFVAATSRIWKLCNGCDEGVIRMLRTLHISHHPEVDIRLHVKQCLGRDLVKARNFDTTDGKQYV